MAQRMAAVSGLYSYTARGLGPRTAISAGWSAVFGYALVAMASLLAVGTYVVELFVNLGLPMGDPKYFHGRGWILAGEGGWRLFPPWSGHAGPPLGRRRRRQSTSIAIHTVVLIVEFHLQRIECESRRSGPLARKF